MKAQELRPPRMMKTAAPRSGVGWLLVVIAIFVGASALVHTVTRNKTVAVGRQQAEVEREIVAYDQEMHALDMKIEEALSRKNLTDRLAAQRTKLRDIQPDDIVRVPRASEP
jgi:cell division protein FtsL